jgi:hypothetical protein
MSASPLGGRPPRDHRRVLDAIFQIDSCRVATRYDKTAESFLGFATLASIRLWIRFVHAA